MAHARQKDALVLVGLLQLCIGLPQTVEQPGTVQRRGHGGHELLHAADLIGAEAGSERPGQNREAACVFGATDLKEQQRRVGTVYLDAMHAIGQRLGGSSDLRDLILVEASHRQHLAVRLHDHRGCAAGQPHRPFERTVGQGSSVLAQKQEILHERTEALFFR